MELYHCILSDLHLGAGDALEDFLYWTTKQEGPSPADRPAAISHLEQRLILFLAQQLSKAFGLGLTPHLLLVGDILDLWQVISPNESIPDAVIRILEAHKPIVAALRDWVASGGLITYVIGNHDQPLVDEKAWAILKEVIPGINRLVDGEPTHFFVDPKAGLYAEHGNQWDPMNRIRSLTKPDADCPGRRLVRGVVNHLEPTIPLLDKGLTIEDFFTQLWEVGTGEGIPVWTEVSERLLRLIGRASGPARLLYEEINGWLNKEIPVPDFKKPMIRQVILESKGLRRAIHPKPGGTIGTLPDEFRFLVSGHTHRARKQVIARGDDRVAWVNSGSWRPALYTDVSNERRVGQKLDFAVIYPQDGDWVTEVDVFPVTDNGKSSVLIT